jgi:phospholipid transport system transporter-binding protein
MITRDGPRLLLSGSITFADAREWRDAVLKEMDRSGLVIDLGGVTEADSTAVSLLLEWRREAKARGYEIYYANLPPAIRSLAEVYGVASLIPSLDPT